MKKDFLSILDITKTELDEILSDADASSARSGQEYPTNCCGACPLQ